MPSHGIQVHLKGRNEVTGGGSAQETGGKLQGGEMRVEKRRGQWIR
jgi:hypothetical protein